MEVEIKTAQDLLAHCIDIQAQRAATRDAENGERSMAKTVAIFKAWTGIDLSEQDGWRFMIALKMARESQGRFHLDDYVDLASYSSLLGECCKNQETTNEQ